MTTDTRRFGTEALVVLIKRHRRWVVVGGLAFLGAAACYRHGIEALFVLRHLDGSMPLTDMDRLYQVVHPWFAGDPVYGVNPFGVYPPASYVVLWPLLGWLPLETARLLWIGLSYVGLAVLSYVVSTRSGATSRAERASLALLPAAMYATTTTIHLGQLTLFVIPLLLLGVILLTRDDRLWWGDVVGSLCMIAALMKPTLAAPFFWIILFVPKRWYPALLVVGGYVLLTWIAASFQEGSVFSVVVGGLNVGVEGAAHGAETGGHANLHTWMGRLDVEELNPFVSLVLLAGLGIWIYKHRSADRWMLMAVCALVARFWTYHRLYDDLLLLFPLVALYRIVRFSTHGPSVSAASGLLVLTAASVLVSARPLFMGFPLDLLFEGIQSTIWLVALVFLIGQTRALHRWKQADRTEPGVEA